MRYCFLLLITFSISSQNLNTFPLWGSSWVIAQGQNKQIFPSVLPLKPCKLALIEFNSNKTIFMSYANLNHGSFRCTAELLDQIRSQFQINTIQLTYDSINSGKIINIAYQPFNDTVWTGDKDIINYLSKYQSIGRITENTDSIFGPADINRLKSNSSCFKSKPVYYGIRSAIESDYNIYNIISIDHDGNQIFLENKDYIEKQSSHKSDIKDLAVTNLQSFSQETPFSNYRKGNKVFEYIPCKYEFRTANIGFWQIHIHPEIWYYPRDPFDGHPLIEDELKMNQNVALAKRNESINNPDNLDLKYYRNPFLSDSASVIISFAFVNTPNIDMKMLNSISLVDSAVDINHFPSRMYRVSGFQIASSWNNYKTALFQLYSEDDIDEDRNRMIDSRCGAWEIIDKQNADLIFPKNLQISNRLIRDRSIDDGIFTYNDCPCSRIPSLNNLTPVQLQRFLFLTPPLCNREEMLKAISTYNQMLNFLKKQSDQKLLKQKIAIVKKVIEERDQRASEAGESWSTSKEECPETWVNNF